MFDTNVKKWIKSTTAEFFDFNSCGDAIDLLEEYLQFTHDYYSDNYYELIIRMCNATDDDKRNMLKEFADIEKYMGQMRTIIGLPKSSGNEADKAGAKTKWTLGALYKDAFRLFRSGDNLHNLSEKGALSRRFNSNEGNRSNKALINDRKYHYLMLYWFRNNYGAHYNEENTIETLTPLMIYKIVSSMLVIELDLCTRFKSELQEAYSKRELENLRQMNNTKEYAASITTNYEQKQNNGFKYLDTFWDIFEKNKEDKRNAAAFFSSGEREITAFCGEAGTGKTTVLRRLEYLYASQCISKADNSYKIPVYIELKKVLPGENPIQVEIGKRLQVSRAVVKQMLIGGNTVLLLDGWNEIKDNEVAKQIRDELGVLLNSVEIKELKTFITDRTHRHRMLERIKSINNYCLHELSFDDKKKYFEDNCKTKKDLNLLLEQIEFEKEHINEDGPKPIHNLKTPLMLCYFLEVVKETHEIPKNYVKQYIELLIKRENEEQKDADDNNNLEYMRTILAALAVIHEDEEGNCEFEALEGQKSIGKVMVKYGYTKPDSLQLLALACKMGILEKTGEVYQFKNDEFFEYFKNYAITSGIDDILED